MFFLPKMKRKGIFSNDVIKAWKKDIARDSEMLTKDKNMFKTQLLLHFPPIIVLYL